MDRLATQLATAVNQFGNRVALEGENGELITYAELDQKVGLLAKALLNNGIKPGDRVGLLLDKSINAIVSILAALRCQAVYVPADPEAPLYRAGQIFSAAQPKLLLTESARVQLPSKWKCQETLLSIGILQPEAASSKPIPSTDNAAYILFTSGSTGRPKGVVVSRDAAFAFADWARTTFSLNPQDAVASIAPFHFDLSIFDLFATLTAGARLLLFSAKAAKNPRMLGPLIMERQVTVLYATPTLLRSLVTYGKISADETSYLRQILYAGEVYPTSELVALLRTFPGVRIANLYGPTETNVVTWYELEKDITEIAKWNDVPIGRACPYAELLLWNGAPLKMETDQEGELLVAGESLAEGYLDAAATEKSFQLIDGVRYYHTGDLVIVDEQGLLVFKGRKDRMVKRRGYRVEPAESEGVLRKHPAVSAAAVVVSTSKGSVRLIAYYALRAAEPDPGPLALMAYCRENLPTYLVPDAFRRIDALPTTPNHKIDYQTLLKTANE